MKSTRPTPAEIQAALEVLLRACEVPTYGLDDFPFWVPEPWERIGVAGMTRRGKSALMKAWCAFLMKRKRRLVVIDVDDEYSPEGRNYGDECQLGPLRQRLLIPEFLELMEQEPEFINRPDLALALVPYDPKERPEEIAEQVSRCAAYLRDADPLVILWEENGYWAEHAIPVLHAASARWGKRGHVPFTVGQCLTDVPEKPRKQWSCIVTAQQIKESDLVFLQRQAGRKARLAVSVLPRLRFAILNLDIPRPEDLAEFTQ